MDNATRSRRQKVGARLGRAVLAGRVTLDAVAKATSRGPRTASEWVSGLRLPPTSVLEVIEALLR